MPHMNNLNLCVCDSLDANSVGFTYSHFTLEHKSLIDHVFVNNDLLYCVSNYSIVQEATNLSDHLPIFFHYLLPVMHLVSQELKHLSMCTDGIKVICRCIICLVEIFFLKYIIHLIVLTVILRVVSRPVMWILIPIIVKLYTS